MSKHELRRLMKGKLSSIEPSALIEKSSFLSKNLHRLLADLHVIQKNFCLGAFAPFDLEPIWFMELSEVEKKQASYPAYDQEAKQMTFKIARMSDLISKMDFGYKILGPADEAIPVIPDVLLIPGLAFSTNGERLGRGKGFYDKFLFDYRGIKVGVCFEVQLVAEMPTEAHDVNLDYIVTEERIINCKLA